MTKLDFSVFGCYFIMMLVIGLLFNKSGTNTRNFFSAGGQVPWWISGLSLYMSFFSSGVFVVWGSIAYQQGLVAVAIQWTMCLAGFAVALWIAPRWKKTGILTAAEYIGNRFGTLLQQLYIYSFVIIGLFVAGAVLYPVALMLQVATGISLFWSTVLLGGVIILYTALGGLWAVLVTDVLQFLLLTVVVILTVFLSLEEVGGVGQFLDQLPESHKALTSSQYTPLFMFSFILVHIFKIGGDWSYIQRFTSVPDKKAARKAGLLFGWLYSISPLVWMIPPMAYFLINPSLDAKGAETAYIEMCRLVLPVGMLGMMLAAMISATASTANTLLNMFAAVFTNDFYKKLIHPSVSERNLMHVARTSTVMFGLLMILIAQNVPNIGGVVELVFSINAITYVPLLAPPVWALFSKRLDRYGMYISIGGGLLVNLFFKFISPYWLEWTLNRTEETFVGLVVTPLLLLAYEAYAYYQNDNALITRSLGVNQTSDLSPSIQISDSQQTEDANSNKYGIRVLAGAFIAIGLGFIIISFYTSANHLLIAFFGLLILLAGVAIGYFTISNYKVKPSNIMKNVHSTSEYRLSADQVEFYRTNGYLILRNKFSTEEVKAWKAEADRLINADFINENNLRTPMSRMSDNKLVLERIDPVVDVSTLYKSLLADERILEPLKSLFEEEPVLFKDKLIFKVPGMKGYDMHQDFAWWQPQPGTNTFKAIHPDKILSVMLAIDPADEENGALELYPTYHHELLSPQGELRNMKEAEISQIDLSSKTLAKTEPGDIIIFHSLTPHSSEPNRSTKSRRQLYMTYNAISCGDAYEGQQLHYQTYVKKRLVEEDQNKEIYFS